MAAACALAVADAHARAADCALAQPYAFPDDVHLALALVMACRECGMFDSLPGALHGQILQVTATAEKRPQPGHTRIQEIEWGTDPRPQGRGTGRARDHTAAMAWAAPLLNTWTRSTFVRPLLQACLNALAAARPSLVSVTANRTLPVPAQPAHYGAAPGATCGAQGLRQQRLFRHEAGGGLGGRSALALTWALLEEENECEEAVAEQLTLLRCVFFTEVKLPPPLWRPSLPSSPVHANAMRAAEAPGGVHNGP